MCLGNRSGTTSLCPRIAFAARLICPRIAFRSFTDQLLILQASNSLMISRAGASARVSMDRAAPLLKNQREERQLTAGAWTRWQRANREATARRRNLKPTRTRKKPRRLPRRLRRRGLPDRRPQAGNSRDCPARIDGQGRISSALLEPARSRRHDGLFRRYSEPGVPSKTVEVGDLSGWSEPPNRMFICALRNHDCRPPGETRPSSSS